MKVTVKFDGDDFKRKAERAAAQLVRQTLASVRCPEHGIGPQVPPERLQQAGDDRPGDRT